MFNVEMAAGGLSHDHQPTNITSPYWLSSKLAVLDSASIVEEVSVTTGLINMLHSFN